MEWTESRNGHDGGFSYLEGGERVDEGERLEGGVEGTGSPPPPAAATSAGRGVRGFGSGSKQYDFIKITWRVRG